MRSAWTIAMTTYADAARRPLYYLLVFGFGILVYGSSFLTLFTFHQEANMVREMGIASITLWGFLIFVVLSGVVITDELEDRTAVTLLAKPVARSAFLLGKYFGLLGATMLGMIVLSGVLLYTLWTLANPGLFGAAPEWAGACLVVGLIGLGGGIALHIAAVRAGYESDLSRRRMRAAFACCAVGGIAMLAAAALASGDRDRADVAWRSTVAGGETPYSLVGSFLASSGLVVLQGFLLSFFQVALLGAVCVSLAAFLPPVVSVAGTALVFILGNLSSYLAAALETGGAGGRAVGRTLYTVLPNLGYFNLQTHFSEGSIVSLRYLGLATLYAVLYASVVLLVSCLLFERREIR